MLLARAAGIPARVVSGWSIARTKGTQTVFTDQAHQWAEVAFEGLGWVAFEPTPGGPPARAPQPTASITKLQRLIKDLFDEDPGIRRDAATELGSLGYPFAARYLLQALSDQSADVRQAALTSLNTIAAATDAISVTLLENGGVVVDLGGLEWWVPGTTTTQVDPPPRRPLFEVSGAEHTAYLRTATGDLYRNGRWLQLDPLSLPAAEPGDIPAALRSMIESSPEVLGSIPDARLVPSLLAGYDAAPMEAHTDVISVVSTSRYIPPGIVPTSLHPQQISSDGSFRPFSVTFYLGTASSSYSWSSTVPAFSEEQLVEAEASSDPTYTQLPEGLPSRIGDLALEITSGHVGPYLKAKAIEDYLKSQYIYSFADTGHDRDRAPPGRDPVDWFLFDHPQGTAGTFSSAFVLLARAAGIPARVVSGWSISRAGVPQTVFTDQAHQWAEVALKGVGWVTFEPTPGGPPTRTSRTTISIPLVIQLIKDLFNEEPEVRKSAAEALGLLGDPVSVEPLVLAAIHDKRNDVRKAAAEALVRIDQAEARYLLVEALSDEALNVRRAASETLGWLGDRAAVTPLVGVTLYDDGRTVRLAAADALNQLDPIGAMELLEDVLDDEDPDSRRAAAEALGFLGNRSAIKGLAIVALYDDSEAVRQAAIQSLNKLDRDGALELLLDDLAADDPDSRAAAAEALGFLGNRAAIGPLLDVILYDDNDRVRRAAANALNRLDQPGATDVLLDTLAVDDPTVRKAAAEALGFLRNRATIKPLADVTLFDDDDRVRRAAADSLNEFHRDIYQDPALEHLLDALANSDAPVRKAAAEALGFLGNRAAVGPLLDVILYDDNDSVRRAAANTLNEIFPDGALGHLLDTLTDEDPTARRAAARALGSLGNRSALHPLADVALYDGDETVRRAAAEALVKLDRARAAEILIQALADEDSIVRRAAAQALGSLGNRSALHPLADVALYDGDETVRQTAAEALAKLDRARAAEILIQALADEETDSRQAASEALEDIGASVTTLENGTSLVTDRNLGYWVPGTSLVTNRNLGYWVPGTTTAQSAGLPRNPVFEVRGAAHTAYLRTATGDVYENGRWRQLDPVDLRYTPPADLPRLVAYAIDTPGGPFSSLTPLRIDHALLAQFTTAPAEQRTVVIHVTPLGPLTAIPAGPAPTSLHLQSASLPGTFRPYSSTLSLERPAAGYSWTSRVAVYSQQQLARATVSPDPTYTQLPDDLPDRIRSLAIDITGGLPGPYAKARAIETYLRIRYPYRFADSEDDLVPSGRDPVDWFLFDHQEGTCGSFSSAFVVLARSVGLPARVVSGWAIAQTASVQTVYTDQGHQWAEVAFDGLGWVSFEPTGGAGGPSSRAALSGDARSQAGDLDDTGIQITGPGDAGSTGAGPEDEGTLQALVEALTDTDELSQQLATKALEDIGASVTTLENGTSLVTNRNLGYWVPGTTTAQSAGLPRNPVFEVRGAAHTAYLRTATGDVYENGRWRQLDPVDLRYTPPADLPSLVASAIDTPGGPFSSLTPLRIDHALLAQFTTAPAEQRTVVIHITPLGSLTAIPAGPAPTSLHLQSASLPGTFRPYSSTLSLERPVAGYSWTSRVAVYSQQQLARATVSPDPTYTQLPDDLPDRIRSLAIDITGGLPGPYAKARAIETYLRIRYPYRFADSEDDLVPPGRDPVDWFLFDHQEGTCGVYSSAFVVLARSVGLPARVVSGWAIAQTATAQTVYTSQAHQWAEVAFDGLGWISFEPTGSGGPVDRVTADGPLQHSEPDLEPADDSLEHPEPDLGPRDTVSEITRSPQQARKGFPFEIGGTVYTTSGAPVDGMEVEIFINEEKVNGGVKIGSGITEDGRFEIEILVPTEFVGGSYQLIAHAMANSNFNESWSDPEISIYSGSEFELTGPTELPVDTEAVFRGKLFEETGSPLAGREIRVSIDGQSALAIVTNAAGSFKFSTTFSQPGRHQIEVDFGRDEFLLGNSARLAIDVTLPTRLAIDAPGQVAVGREFTLTGALRDVRGEPLSGKSIDLSMGGSTIEQVQTDSEGNFSVAHSITAGPGEYVIVAEFTGEGTVLGSTDRVKVTAVTATVSVEDPKPVARGHTVTLRGVVTVGGELAPGEDIALDGGAVRSHLCCGRLCN